MIKMLLLFVNVGLLMIINQSLSAQNKTAAGKLFYFELGGPGVVMSANYDSRFTSKTRLGFGYRLGIGIIQNCLIEGDSDYDNSMKGLYEQFTKSTYTFPAGLNYVFGRPNKFSVFEIGAGITYLTQKMSLYHWDVKKPGNVVGHFAFMYRIMPLNKGFSFRGGFTPMIGTAGDLFPMGAVSFGYSF